MACKAMNKFIIGNKVDRSSGLLGAVDHGRQRGQKVQGFGLACSVVERDYACFWPASERSGGRYLGSHGRRTGPV